MVSTTHTQLTRPVGDASDASPSVLHIVLPSFRPVLSAQRRVSRLDRVKTIGERGGRKSHIDHPWGQLFHGGTSELWSAERADVLTERVAQKHLSEI